MTATLYRADKTSAVGGIVYVGKSDYRGGKRERESTLL